MQTDHQLLIVLNQGLLSLADGMRQLVADIERMEADGMLRVSRFLPYVPCVLLPQGTTGSPKRRTSDSGSQTQAHSARP
jgi:hypothetical protein